MKKEELSYEEESEDDDHVDSLLINTDPANTASGLVAGSYNSSDQDCEETLQADDADNAKRSFKRKIKRWCGYVADCKKI